MNPIPHQHPQWAAVTARDRAADGTFVYAAKTTGVFCRPSCPSRRPKPENVVFYRTPAQAAAAGYRPCRRCKPTETAADPTLERVRRACTAIDRALNEGESGAPSLSALAKQVGVGPHHLLRLFQRHLGITPRDYADARRLGLVKRHLKAGNGVADALYAAGYGSPSRLYERADAQLGMTPATYRRAGKGAAIGYTIVRSPLGRLLVAATERGLAAVTLGDNDAAVEAAFRQEYPAADIVRDDSRLKPAVDAILAHLSGTSPALDLPLDIQATAFKRRVWRALQAIPYGTTATYAEIARAVGAPKAARAVGNACATNPVSIVIPCHRVVRGDGSLGGYAWGLERKKALIARERAVAELASPAGPAPARSGAAARRR